MEHLNQMCKDVLSNLGANKTPRAIVRAGKAAGNHRDIVTLYDATNTIDHGSFSSDTPVRRKRRSKYCQGVT